MDRTHEEDLAPLNRQRAAMTDAHRAERAKLKAGQKRREQHEAKERSLRLNKGLRGLWDKVTGQSSKLKQQNEREAWEAAKRDQTQRDDLVKAHLKEKQRLQAEIDKLRRKHAQDRRMLAREIAQTMRTAEQVEKMQTMERQRYPSRAYRGPSL